MLTAKHDFKEQKGRLQEELECRGWLVIFYPKFHCELNVIKRYWCGCKWYARENCQYTLDGLGLYRLRCIQSPRQLFTDTIFIDPYESGATTEFKEWVYKAYLQISDKPKW